MEFVTTKERTFLQQISEIVYCNPFLPERIECERRILGKEYVQGDAVWSLIVDAPETPDYNPILITERTEVCIERLRQRLRQQAEASPTDLQLYQDAVLWVLYHHYQAHFGQILLQPGHTKTARQRFPFYKAFVQEWGSYFAFPGYNLPTAQDAAHLFACFFQIRRAFHHVIRFIIGSSPAAAQLRATIWQSIFTPNMQRYQRTLYERMGDFPTLILGPSGTGKELVARAIGLSRYIPFDPAAMSFSEDFADQFHPLNLSALPSTLIESELFGHRKGAYTGALQDRAGWLEVCRPFGTVFLDEIGELDATVQVKLLRVLQNRTFQRLGDTTEHHFQGKLIAATNRDLVEAMHQNSFREDFYYRLCADMIVTPSLREQLAEAPQTLYELLVFITNQVVGTDAEDLVAEVEAWIEQHIGLDYAWPGNIRELEQCVRNVLVHQAYHPPRPHQAPNDEDFSQAVADGSMTAEELLCWYCTKVYSQTGSYEETARRLQLDYRTVKKKVATQLFRHQRQLRSTAASKSGNGQAPPVRPQRKRSMGQRRAHSDRERKQGRENL